MKRKVNFKTVGSTLRRAGFKPAGDFKEGFRIYKPLNGTEGILIDHDPEDDELFDGDWTALVAHCASQLRLYKAALELNNIEVSFVKTGIPNMPLCLCATFVNVVEPLKTKRGYIKAVRL